MTEPRPSVDARTVTVRVPDVAGASIVEAILNWRQPSELQLEELLRPFQVGWREQRMAFSPGV